jgi:acetylornithine/succinyldiaminopimelate/putrescine aminotransferase
MLRITPPLTISDDEIREGCAIMLEVMDEVLCQHKLKLAITVDKHYLG